MNSKACFPQILPAVLLSAAAVLTGCGGGAMSSSSPTPTPTPTGSCTVQPVTISHSTTNTNPAQIIFLNAAKYPQALCNDGSSPAYILRPGSGSASTRWVISLQGGDKCYDQTTCSARAVNSPQLISSKPYQGVTPGSLDQTGILSANSSVNPDFYDASTVQLLYCSSDEWSGNKTGSGAFDPNNDATWNFQGHAIVAAVLADLEANHGLSSATEVLFTGQSAGGVGAYVNVNAVQKLLPASARFVAASDAGFADPVDSFDPNGAPPNYTASGTPQEIQEHMEALTLWNGSGDSVCAGLASSPTEQVNCYSAAQLLGTGGTITLPMLVSEAQQDKVQLNTNGVSQSDINSGNFTPAESGYVSYFAASMRTSLNGTGSGVSIFSPDALLHIEQTDNTLFSATYSFPDGSHTLQQVTGAWYRDPCTVQRDIAN